MSEKSCARSCGPRHINACHQSLPPLRPRFLPHYGHPRLIAERRRHVTRRRCWELKPHVWATGLRCVIFGPEAGLNSGIASLCSQCNDGHESPLYDFMRLHKQKKFARARRAQSHIKSSRSYEPAHHRRLLTSRAFRGNLTKMFHVKHFWNNSKQINVSF
jgi:hypothetical protein